MLNIEKRFKQLEVREKMLRYAYDPKARRIPGLAKNAYIHELKREERIV
jgi:hypothetical protein